MNLRLLLVLGIAGFAAFFVFSHAAPKSNFDSVREGMTEPEVRSLLGVPDGSNTTAYYYGGFLCGKWCTMEIFFGTDGRVTGKFHDH